MTINRTTLLDLPLPVTGTEENTWGDVTNNGLTDYLDIAIAGLSSLTSANFTAGAVTIETTEGTSLATNIAATSAQYAGFKVSSLAQNSTITVGNSGATLGRAYRIINADATYTLTFKATGQTGVTFQPGTTGLVAFNGTDYEVIGVVGPASATDNAVARFDGTTGQFVQNSVVTIADSTGDMSGVGALSATGATFSGLTASQAVFTNGSKALVSNAITGTGDVVMSTSPTLTTPNLGTPSAATLTNATGLPLSTGVTGTLPYGNGGTGQTSYTDGQLLIGKTDGSLAKATLTAGSNVTITNGDGTITIASSGGGGGGGGTSVTVTQATATASQTTFNVTYTVGQLSVYLNGALLASADYTASNGTTVVLASGATAGDIFTALAYDSATQITQGDSSVVVTDTGSDGTITFDTDGSERMRVTNAGSVLINGTSSDAKFAVANNTNAGVYNAKIYGVFGPTTAYLDSDAAKLWGTGVGELQVQNGTATRPPIFSMGGSVDALEAMGVINFFRSDNSDNYRSRAVISAVTTNTGTADQYGGILTFRTASDGGQNTSERARIAETGELLVGKTSVTANGGVLQVSNGITFPATAVACSDVNTLDDYEEGTWTPTIIGTTSAGTATYATRVGRYTKIGNIVQYDAYISYSSGTGTGDLRVSGLPFTSSSGSYPPAACTLENIALTANSYAVPYVQNSNTFVVMAQNPTGGGGRNAIAYDVSGEIQLQGTYSI